MKYEVSTKAFNKLKLALTFPESQQRKFSHEKVICQLYVKVIIEEAFRESPREVKKVLLFQTSVCYFL